MATIKLQFLIMLAWNAVYAASVVNPMHRVGGGYGWVRDPARCPDPDRIPVRFMLPDAKPRWYEVRFGVQEAKCAPRQDGFWIYRFGLDGKFDNKCNLDVGCNTIPDEYCIELIDGGYEKFADQTGVVSPKWGIKVHGFAMGQFANGTSLAFFVGTEDDYKQCPPAPYDTHLQGK